MPTGSDLVLVVLAAWRIAFMLVYEMGPFDVIDWIRSQLGANNLDVMTRGFWSKLFGCVPCMTFWTAAILILWWLPTWPIARQVHDAIRFYGIWGGASALHIAINRE